MRSNSTIISQLQMGLNTQYDAHILYNKTQFYSEEQNRAVNIYTIKKSVWDEDKGKNKYVELFSSTSQLQIILFLRDLLYKYQGKPIPHDNEMWEEAKRQYENKISGVRE